MSKLKSFLSKVLFSVVVILLTFVFLPQNTIVKAQELTDDEYDRLFIATVEEYIGDNYNGTVNLTATKDIIYDMDLKEFGYIYDFELNDKNGYATIIDSRGYPELAEIYFDALYPFSCDETCSKIYIKNLLYIYYSEGSYYLTTGDVLTEEEIETLKNVSYYSGATDIEIVTETIYYTTKVETAQKQLADRYPAVDAIAYNNACAPIAGTNLIQYWDRYFPNLIEDYSPGIEIGSHYFYSFPNKTVTNVGAELYELMGTNTNGAGTTINQFKNGMTQYCSKRGYNISYASCMNFGKFSYSKAKERIDKGEPLVIFTEPVTFAKIESGEGSDEIHYYKMELPHTLVAFGYKDIKYTLSNGQTRTDNYLEVESGAVEYKAGYCNVNYETTIDDAYGVLVS